MIVVGVIGGGAAGLCSVRHISAYPHMKPILWEQTSNIGGTWVYCPDIGTDKYGLPVHSSMYKNLTTNLPKEVMAFPDFPFPKYRESFIHHSEVLKYLEDYATHFNLHKWIKLHHHVERVDPIYKKNSPPAWSVTVKRLCDGTVTTTICDYLLVCNGHYAKPRYPKIPNIKKFKGICFHSKDYRESRCFEGLTVVVLGAAASGLDLSIEVSKVAGQVYLSHNLPSQVPSELPRNIKQVRGVVAAEKDGFYLSCGAFLKADAILFCTGYEYSFPFLSKNCGITVENNIVKPLYKHLVNTTYPSMALIGIPFKICPFPLFHMQIQYYMKYIVGQLKLPCKGGMDKDTEREQKEKEKGGCPRELFHQMGKSQWAYNEELAKAAHVECIPKAVENLYEEVHSIRSRSLTTYKKDCYAITGPDSYKKLP